MKPLRIISPEDPATPPENPDSDEEEFVAALTAHQAALQAFIHSLMPGDSSCDDVLQRANMTLWRKRKSFTLGTNFRAWAFEVAKWTVRSYFKEKGRKHWLIYDESLTTAVAAQMIETLPTQADDQQVALRECLAKLREIDRDLLISHYEEEESLAEFAERSNRSAGGLKVTLFRLRATLRRCISSRIGLQKIHQARP